MATKLTEEGRGKHHLGDFLPPDELEKFMEKCQAIKEGRTPDLSDYKVSESTVERVKDHSFPGSMGSEIRVFQGSLVWIGSQSLVCVPWRLEEWRGRLLEKMVWLRSGRAKGEC